MPQPVRLAVVGYFLAALAVAAAGIKLVVPPVSNETRMVEAYVARSQDFDTLFIGSSHVIHQVDADEFDQVTAAAGHPTHSAVLGEGALSHLEARAIIEQILARAPHLPKRIIFEPNIGVFPNFGETLTAREIAFHDPVNTSRYLAYLAATDRFESPLRDLAVGAVKATGMNVFNIGVVSEALRRGHDVPVLGGPEGNGFQPLVGRAPNFPDAYEEIIGVRAHEANPIVLSPGQLDSVTAIVDLCRTAGVEAIVLLPPVWSAWQMTAALQRQLPEVRPDIRMLKFFDAGRYPELYDRANRWDPGHLNAGGAKMLARMVAARFLAVTTAEADR